METLRLNASTAAAATSTLLVTLGTLPGSVVRLSSFGRATTDLETMAESLRLMYELAAQGDSLLRHAVSVLSAILYGISLTLQGFNLQFSRHKTSSRMEANPGAMMVEGEQLQIKRELENLTLFLQGQFLSLSNSLAIPTSNVTPMLPNSKISSIPSRIGGFYQTAQLSTQPAPFEGHTFGNIDVRDSATVQLGDNYIDHYNVYNNYADNGGHDEVISKLEAQNVAMSDVQKKLAPLAQASQRAFNKVTLLHEANQVQHDVLLDIQSSVRKIPSLTRSDSIQFIDALDRHYELPFTHFAHWQVFEGFLKSHFDMANTAGAYQVNSGRFLLTRNRDSGTALTSNNWKSMLHPGCQITMSILIEAFSLTVRSCPRPRCRMPSSTIYQEGKFTACSNCGLVYGFDPRLELPTEIQEDHVIHARQASEDLLQFGGRVGPTDVVSIHTKSITFSNVAGLQRTKLHNKTLSSSTESSSSDDSDEDEPAYAKTDTNANERLQKGDGQVYGSELSGIERWLNSSVLPEKESLSAQQDQFAKETMQQRREKDDLNKLKRVIFVATEQPTKPLNKTVPKFDQLPLELQIYTRKILDKFPALPPTIATRLARTNVDRKQRLPGLRMLPDDEDGVELE